MRSRARDYSGSPYAIVVTSAGAAIATYLPGMAAAAGGGLVVATGIATMHYLGMAAMQLPGRIEWRTAFWPLLTGRLRMRMRQTDAMRDPVMLEATWRGATLSAGSIGVPASLLTGLGAPFNTLALDGAVQLTWSPWRVIGSNSYGRLSVTLTDVSSRASPVRPLGSYRAQLQAQGASSTIELTTLKGPLLLNGQGTVSRTSTSFQGTASATADQRDNLAGLLNLLGRPTTPGTVALSFSR